MKIFKSIKWRLQIWYGLILVVVLAGFGFTAYQLERGRQFGRMDEELQRRFGILANALHRPPPRGPIAGEPPFYHPPHGQFPGNEPPGQNQRPPFEFHLPPDAAGLFGTNDPNDFYYVIQRGGQEIALSTNVPRGEEFHDQDPMATKQLNPHPELPANDNLGNVNNLLVPENPKMWTPEGLREIKRNRRRRENFRRRFIAAHQRGRGGKRTWPACRRFEFHLRAARNRFCAAAAVHC
jgi:hypothetical protein